MTIGFGPTQNAMGTERWWLVVAGTSSFGPTQNAMGTELRIT